MSKALAIVIMVLAAMAGSAMRAESCLQLLTGLIGAGNYTYYRLAHEGDVDLSLWSTVGDADLYVSTSTLQPTFELDSFDLHCATCGEDRIKIPFSFKRPVGIGIYGHPSHELSSYQLCVNFAPASADDAQAYDRNSYEDDGESQEHWSRKSQPHVGYPSSKADDDDAASLLWDILIGGLKVIVEVFM